MLVLLNAETAAKMADFQELADMLKTERRHMMDAPGLPLLLDTNVLLQCLPPWQIPWTRLLGEPTRLIVPLRVIEEIDAKKYGRVERLRGVAREVLSGLEGRFGNGAPGPVVLAGSSEATIELLYPSRPRFYPDDADEEILDVLEHVRMFAGRATLATADTGMLLRARTASREVFKVPGEYLRLRAEPVIAREN